MPRADSTTDREACAGHHGNRLPINGNRPPVISVCGDDLSVTDLASVIAPSGGTGYDRHAARYDHDTGHFNDFRKRAVSALGLRPGDTVLDVGCGTGLCFSWIQDRVG